MGLVTILQTFSNGTVGEHAMLRTNLGHADRVNSFMLDHSC